MKIGELNYTEITPDGVLRHPSFVGLREDKPAKDVHIEVPAAKPKTTTKTETRARPAARKSSPKGKAVSETSAFTDDMGVAVAERLGVKLTNPGRPVLPNETVTKGQIVAYYDAVAERMLPHIERRPLSLVRVPHGQRPFFQKHDSGGFPETRKHVQIDLKESEKEDHFYIDDLAGLVGGVQMSTLEFHIWGSRIDKLEKPDRIIFDIDPDEGLDFSHVREAAAHIRDLLGVLGLQTFPMVTGGKGIHVIAPLKPKLEWPEVKDFCHSFAQMLEDTEPEHFTANIRKVKRQGRMFVDYLRNERGSTAVSPFSTRAKPGIPCAVPVAWSDLDGIEAANMFHLSAAAERAQGPDPWPDYFKLTQTITSKMIDAMEAQKK